jgi:hypothetical protein
MDLSLKKEVLRNSAPFPVDSTDSFIVGVTYGLRRAAARMVETVGETASSPMPHHLSASDMCEIMQHIIQEIRDEAASLTDT